MHIKDCSISHIMDNLLVFYVWSICPGALMVGFRGC